MRIVGRTHSRTYRPELCISIRAFGAQAFIVTALTVWGCLGLSGTVKNCLGLSWTL